MRLGPHCFLLLLMGVLCACGGRGSASGSPTDRNRPLLRPLEMYEKLGLLIGSAEFPAVARIAPVAGPGDSAFLLLTVSIPNTALRFQRRETGFQAEYRVQVNLQRDTAQTRRDRRESVHVQTFNETARSEESVIFQDVITVAPGIYHLRLRVSDVNSNRALSVQDTIAVPSYPTDRTLSTPMLVHRSNDRRHRTDVPAFLINARNTVAYGADTPQLYLELYGAAQPQSVRLRALDESGGVVWSTVAPMLNGDVALRSATVAIPADSLPIGRVWIETSTQGTDSILVPILVTISDDWLVANFDEMLQFLRYIAYPAEMDSLRKTTGVERNRHWEKFWERRDPSPGSPANEFRDEFFRRVRFAIEELNEPGRPGWKTERGEVYIVLGPPSYVLEQEVTSNNLEEEEIVDWVYDETGIGRKLILRFIDRNGFGRFELTQSSRTAFMAAVHRALPK
ncbi:MAG TPA: GWxTD domain-containing protein [Longimicrobiales bacterium]|nr:GWxTD domain-containing protein [Longimicrobiales bacterium]